MYLNNNINNVWYLLGLKINIETKIFEKLKQINNELRI